MKIAKGQDKSELYSVCSKTFLSYALTDLELYGSNIIVKEEYFDCFLERLLLILYFRRVSIFPLHTLTFGIWFVVIIRNFSVKSHLILKAYQILCFFSLFIIICTLFVIISIVQLLSSFLQLVYKFLPIPLTLGIFQHSDVNINWISLY